MKEREYGRRGVNRGKMGFAQYTFVTVHLKEVMKMMIWSLNHSIFKIGNQFLKQNIGAPMGDPMAPQYATMTCAYAEFCFLKSLGTDKRHGLFGGRYIDDLLAMLAYRKGDEQARKKALQMVQFIQKKLYPK